MQSDKKYKILIVAPVPFYYHIPLYRRLNSSAAVDLEVIYCSDETLKGTDVKKMYHTKAQVVDKEELLRGYHYKFLKNYSWDPSFMNWPFGLMNLGIWREIRNSNCDAVIFQSWTNLTWWLAFFSCLVLKRKIFFMTDSNVAADYNKSFTKKMVKKIWLEKFLFRYASGFLTSGTANEEFYQYYGVSKNKIRRFPFSWGYEALLSEGEKLISHREDIRKSLEVSPEDFIILYVGRLSREKSLITLLEAYGQVQAKNKKLFFVGDGPLRGEMEEKAKELGLENIKFFGFQPRESVFKFYSASDVLVLPSAQETWGIVINEGMCFGCPIIASDQVGAAVDLVKKGENGFTFTSRDSKALKNRLEKLASLSSDERISFGKKSKEIMVEWVNGVDPEQQIISLLK